MIDKLIIGTANFGQKYGIANNKSLEISKIRSIINQMRESDIRMIDTAIAYGDAEEKLGAVDLKDFKIITKIPLVRLKEKQIKEKLLHEMVSDSLKRMQIDHLEGVLLHAPNQIFTNEWIYDQLQKLKESNLVKKIGVSVNFPSEIESLVKNFDFDIAQIPYNILDGRWKSALHDLNSRNIEVHARSIFLQGLLLMKKELRPPKFNRWSNILNLWDSQVKSSQHHPVDICIGHVMNNPLISKLVVGVDSSMHLEKIISASQKKISIEKDLSIEDSSLLSPMNW